MRREEQRVWEVTRLSAVRWDGTQQATQACKNRHSNPTVMSTIESWWIIITSRRNRRPAPQLMEITAALVQKLGWCTPVKLWDFRAGTIQIVKRKHRWPVVAVFSIAQFEIPKWDAATQNWTMPMGWREELSLLENPLVIITELLYPLLCTKKYVSEQPPPAIQYAALILSQGLWRHSWKTWDSEMNAFKKLHPLSKLRLQLVLRMWNEISLSTTEIASQCFPWWLAARAVAVLGGFGGGAGWWQGVDRTAPRWWLKPGACSSTHSCGISSLCLF